MDCGILTSSLLFFDFSQALMESCIFSDPISTLAKAELAQPESTKVDRCIAFLQNLCAALTFIDPSYCVQ